jgi:hypothetical protein
MSESEIPDSSRPEPDLSGSDRSPPEQRYQVFAAARHRAECSIQQLWVQYLSLGGVLDLFTVEAFLHGLVPLSAAQQDILANAINERLDDLYRGAMVPYLHILDFPTSTRDPLTALDELFQLHPPDRTGS